MKKIDLSKYVYELENIPPRFFFDRYAAERHVLWTKILRELVEEVREATK